MNYPKSRAYETPELMAMMMGPNPVKLTEELLDGHPLGERPVVCDLGSGMGLTSAFMAREYGFTVYACDLWSEPQEHVDFFEKMAPGRITPVKADATSGLPFEKEFFDAVVSVDAYHYFGSDPALLDEKILPFVKQGGYVMIAIPGMKKDCHDDLPEVLLRSWTPEALTTMHDAAYWRAVVGQCQSGEVVTVEEMESMDEVWDDWLRQENPYAVGDRKTMRAGGGAYLNFIRIVVRKK